MNAILHIQIPKKGKIGGKIEKKISQNFLLIIGKCGTTGGTVDTSEWNMKGVFIKNWPALSTGLRFGIDFAHSNQILDVFLSKRG